MRRALPALLTLLAPAAALGDGGARLELPGWVHTLKKLFEAAILGLGLVVAAALLAQLALTGRYLAQRTRTRRQALVAASVGDLLLGGLGFVAGAANEAVGYAGLTLGALALLGLLLAAALKPLSAPAPAAR